MKNLKNKRNLIVIIIIIVILLLIIFGLYLYVHHDTPKINSSNGYSFINDSEEVAGTTIYTNERLKEEHCLDNICISNLEIHYYGSNGRVDYTITNKNDNTKPIEGYMKIDLGFTTVLVSYRNLSSSKVINSSSNYYNISFEECNDYTLSNLTDEEISKIKVSKKK